MLEKKLREVKEEVMSRLEQGEMEDDQYYRTVHELLVKEGVAKGEYCFHNSRLAIKIGCAIQKKIKTDEYTGVDKSYITLKGKELSPEAQQDVQNLVKLIDGARGRVKERAANGEINEREFDETIKSYIENQTEVPISDDLRRGIIKGTTMVILGREFNVVREPVKYGGITEHDLEKAIEKM